MSFDPLTIGSKIFNSIGQGLYSLSTLTFSDPIDQVKISGGKRGSKTGPISASISRHREKAVNITTGSPSRPKCSVVLQLNVPEGFTPTEVDEMITEISTFADLGTLNRILQGEA